MNCASMHQTEGTYTKEKFIASGSNVMVYLVRDSIDQELYVLKNIHIPNQSFDQALQQATRQTEIHQSLDHPNIVKLKEHFFNDQNQNYALVMEHCPEGDIYDKIVRISPDKCQEFMKQTLKALVYLHGNDIIHRDVKPANILLKNGVYKLCDFGTAIKVDSSSTLGPIGTESYRPPEMFEQNIENMNYDFKVDVWSLGVVFLEMNLRTHINSLVQGGVRPGEQEGFPSEQLLNRVMNPSVRNLIRKMLRRDANERISSGQALNLLTGVDNNPIQVASSSLDMTTNDETELNNEKSLSYAINESFIDATDDNTQIGRSSNILNEQETDQNTKNEQSIRITISSIVKKYLCCCFSWKKSQIQPPLIQQN